MRILPITDYQTRNQNRQKMNLNSQPTFGMTYDFKDGMKTVDTLLTKVKNALIAYEGQGKPNYKVEDSLVYRGVVEFLEKLAINFRKFNVKGENHAVYFGKNTIEELDIYVGRDSLLKFSPKKSGEFLSTLKDFEFVIKTSDGEVYRLPNLKNTGSDYEGYAESMQRTLISKIEESKAAFKPGESLADLVAAVNRTAEGGR